jgi:hypothetical protein
MERAENDLNFELALQYSKFIIEIYRDLGVVDDQALDDESRIERKIELEDAAENYIRRARAAEDELRYADAARAYEMVMELYREIGIGVGHERYRDIVEEIVRLEDIIAGVIAPGEAREPVREEIEEPEEPVEPVEPVEMEEQENTEESEDAGGLNGQQLTE